MHKFLQRATSSTRNISLAVHNAKQSPLLVSLAPTQASTSRSYVSEVEKFRAEKEVEKEKMAKEMEEQRLKKKRELQRRQKKKLLEKQKKQEEKEREMKLKKKVKNLIEKEKLKEKERKKRLEMKKNDPNAPKRAMTPFIWFFTKNFSIIKSNYPDLAGAPEIMKEAKKQFENLSEEDRKYYDSLAEEDNKRYQKEKEEYLNSKKKKPMTSYLLFAAEKRGELENSMKDNFENRRDLFLSIAKETGKLWKALSEGEKAKYKELSQRNKEEMQKEQTKQ